MMRAAPIALLVLLMVPIGAAQVPATPPVAEQAHVTLSEKTGMVWVQWAFVGLDALAPQGPTVLWRVDGGPEQRTGGALVGRLKQTGSVIEKSTGVPATIYAAEIGPIPAGAKVAYQVGFTQGFAAPRSFKMVPGPDEPVTFLAYGDIGVDDTAPDGSRTTNRPEYPAFEIRDLAIAQEPDLVIIPGDLAYSNSAQGWNAFMRFMEPLQSRTITMPVVGNHEYHAGDGIGYGQFLSEYVLPNDEHMYAFQAGPVTFIGMNSDTICGPPNTAQAGSPPRPCGSSGLLGLNTTATSWLEGQLQAANEDATPWTVVYFHHPSLSWGRHGITWSVHSYWSPLFEKYGVDLVVTAHDHLYGRTYPTLGRTPVVTNTTVFTQGAAPVYVVLGGGGRDLYTIPEDPPPAWFAKGEVVHHLARIRANATHLEYEAIRKDKSLLDAFTIRAASPTGEDPSDVPGPDLVTMLLLAGVLVAIGRRRTRRP